MFIQFWTQVIAPDIGASAVAKLYTAYPWTNTPSVINDLIFEYCFLANNWQ